MARVTELNYYMDDMLKVKCDLMVDRCTKKNFDNLLIFDGDEGYGKTTMSIGVAKYFSHETGRAFSVKNIFFDLDKMMDFAMKNKEQIILWDEAALGGLSDQFRSQLQTKLIQLLMVARKKKHIWIFNIPKFFKLREYIILDRAIGLIHVYARNEIDLGRFVYYSKKKKERLYYNFKRTRVRNYKKFADFHGTFPDVLAQIIDEDEYDKMKDKAILSIGEDAKTNHHVVKLVTLQHKIATRSMNDTALGKVLGINRKTIAEWRKLPEKYKFLKEDNGTDTL